MRTFKEETAELHLAVTGASRRRFLVGVGGAGAALVAGPIFLPSGPLLAPAAAQDVAEADAEAAVYAESLELALVAAYRMVTGKLSAATRPVGELFAQHHQDHAGAFAALAGGKATGKPNGALVTALTPTLEGVKDEKGALEVAFMLESQAAETHAFTLTVLSLPEAIEATATILPVESMHAGVLGGALGKGATEVFPTGGFISADVGDGSDPAMGFDPGLFPVG